MTKKTEKGIKKRKNNRFYYEVSIIFINFVPDLLISWQRITFREE